MNLLIQYRPFYFNGEGTAILIGPNLSAYELRLIVEAGAPLFWDRQGEVRMLPVSVVADLYRLVQARQDLTRLGRDTWEPDILAFTWDQALPLTEGRDDPIVPPEP
jgi:hypothetical protein